MTMLTLEELIIETHADFDNYAAILTGFDDMGRFVVQMEYENDRRQTKSLRQITVEKEEAWSFAHRQGIRLTDLPRYFYQEFGVQTDFFTPAEVRNLFGRIQDFMDCHRLVYRTSGRNMP